MVKAVIKYIIAILLEKKKLTDNKGQERLEMHYVFNQEDIIKQIDSQFNTENE